MIEAWQIQKNRWEMIRQKSVNWRIFSGMVTVGGFHLIVSIAMIGKELVVAYQFGTSSVMDAFLIAFLLPSLAISIIAGSFPVAFMPEYIKVREEDGPEQAGQLFSGIMVLYLVFLILLSLVLFAISPFIIPYLGTSFDASKLALSESLFLVLVPIFLISGLIKAWGTVMNAGERFALTAISPIIIPIITVLVLFGRGEQWGIHALATGMLAGFLGEAGLLAWRLKSRGFMLMPKWHRLNASAKRIIYQYMPMIAGAFLMSGTAFVDQTMAAAIGPGSVSAINYGNKVIQSVLGMLTIALGTAILPYFSKMVASSDWRGIRHTLWVYGRLILLCSVPLTLIFIFFSEPIIALIFERGAFLKADTRLVGEIQWFYAFQIPFYILGILGVRLLSALKQNKVLMVIAGINLLANIAGNYIFIQYFGVSGIGLSTSVVYAISTGLIFIALSRQLKREEISSF